MISVLKANASAKTTVMRSRFFSITVDPAAEAPRPPPNMSESPPPRPLWMSTKKISPIPRPNCSIHKMTVMIPTAHTLTEAAPWNESCEQICEISPYSQLLVVSVLHDRSKLIRFKAGPADKCTINIRLRHQLSNVAGLHRATVLNPN